MGHSLTFQSETSRYKATRGPQSCLGGLAEKRSMHPWKCWRRPCSVRRGLAAAAAVGAVCVPKTRFLFLFSSRGAAYRFDPSLTDGTARYRWHCSLPTALLATDGIARYRRHCSRIPYVSTFYVFFSRNDVMCKGAHGM